ncbi:MAG: hypothetical protein JWN26_332 [Candidatus Saccharibacteria bacterium]|nr:hypothetical protein [Candidatus Saccharibacteria bacterium]
MKSRRLQIGSVHLVIVIVLIAVVLGLLGFAFWNNFIKKTDTTSKVTPVSSSTKAAPNDITTKKFISQKYGISFAYPSNWIVSERVNTAENTDKFYSDNITVSDDQNNIVATLGTGGQVGGECDPSAPMQAISTLIDDPLSIPGINTTAHFGYTIVTKTDGTFGIGYGLNNGKLTKGDSSVQCPSMSVNYAYLVSVEGSPLVDITFGSWYAETAVDQIGLTSFATLKEAQSYADSPKFLQIEATIKSLTIAN